MSSPNEMPKKSWSKSVPEGVEVPRCWCGDLCKLRESTVFDYTYGRRFFMCANYDSNPLPSSGLYDRPLTPSPLCSFNQWLDTEQSEDNKESVRRELEWRRGMREHHLYELEQEGKRKRFQQHLRKMKEEEHRAKEKREEERERKREMACRAKEDAEDSRGKGKYPRWTQ